MRPITDDNRHWYVALSARVLSSPEAVAHPQWPTLVTEVADATQSHEDLLREYCEATGVKFSRRMLDDELPEIIHCMMSDEGRHTIDAVVNVLATEAAVAHPAGNGSPATSASPSAGACRT